jgi:hypothetical protein
MVECFIGALIAGLVSKKHGAILGAVVAYCFILTSVLVFYCMLSAWTPEVSGAKLYSGWDYNWSVFSNSTAIFIGLIGGMLGEFFSKFRFLHRTA